MKTLCVLQQRFSLSHVTHFNVTDDAIVSACDRDITAPVSKVQHKQAMLNTSRPFKTAQNPFCVAIGHQNGIGPGARTCIAKKRTRKEVPRGPKEQAEAQRQFENCFTIRRAIAQSRSGRERLKSSVMGCSKREPCSFVLIKYAQK